MFGVKIDKMLCSVALRMNPLPGFGFAYYSVRAASIARHPTPSCAFGQFHPIGVVRGWHTLLIRHYGLSPTVFSHKDDPSGVVTAAPAAA